MMTSLESTTISSTDLRASLDLIEVKPGLKFSVGTLRELLPDVETLLFFGKVYELDHVQLSAVLSQVLQSDLATALFSGDHSTDLQGYLVDIVDEYGTNYYVAGLPTDGELSFKPDVPKGEILPELWKSLEVEVATSIKQVAAKLSSVVGLMPGKQGKMLFANMLKLNVKRPTFGDYRAKIQHDPVKDNLLILDVSGSMNSTTVAAIINDVVALAYMANAHLAIVSDNVTYWEPGSYEVAGVLRAATYGGTHYETLQPLMNREWGVVITVADYDSSASAKTALARCSGSIDQVLDISLVNRPTFLAECVGQLAAEVKPLLIANTYQVLV